MTCHRPVSSSNIIDHHNITEILFNVVLNTIMVLKLEYSLRQKPLALCPSLVKIGSG
jgi:hypothetical protein